MGRREASGTHIHSPKMLTPLVFLALTSALCLVFWRPSPSLSFAEYPVIYGGHTAVHMINQQGQPFAPAYMVFHKGEPRFYHLYTNATIGTYRDYTKTARRASAYKTIHTSTPLYKGYSLYQILQTKPFNLTHPAIKKIYKERARVWWERCVKYWEEFHPS